MCGSEPKSICTGATLHTLCVTHDPSRTYKLFARVCGGAKDEDLSNTKRKITSKSTKVGEPVQSHVGTIQGEGVDVSQWTDSAYTSDII